MSSYQSQREPNCNSGKELREACELSVEAVTSEFCLFDLGAILYTFSNFHLCPGSQMSFFENLNEKENLRRSFSLECCECGETSNLKTCLRTSNDIGNNINILAEAAETDFGITKGSISKILVKMNGLRNGTNISEKSKPISSNDNKITKKLKEKESLASEYDANNDNNKQFEAGFKDLNKSSNTRPLSGYCDFIASSSGSEVLYNNQCNYVAGTKKNPNAGHCEEGLTCSMIEEENGNNSSSNNQSGCLANKDSTFDRNIRISGPNTIEGPVATKSTAIVQCSLNKESKPIDENVEEHSTTKPFVNSGIMASAESTNGTFTNSETISSADSTLLVLTDALTADSTNSTTIASATPSISASANSILVTLAGTATISSVKSAPSDSANAGLVGLSASATTASSDSTLVALASTGTISSVNSATSDSADAVLSALPDSAADSTFVCLAGSAAITSKNSATLASDRSTLLDLSDSVTTDSPTIASTSSATLASGSSTLKDLSESVTMDSPTVASVTSATTSSSARNKSCKECGKMFHSNRALSLHCRLKHIATKFVCSICNQKFAREHYLKRHMVKHDESNRTCSTCLKVFVKKSNMIQHMRIHTGEKKYTCDKCGKTFTDRSTLNSHLVAIHNGIKKFTCSYCEMAFCHKGHLNVHLKKHKKDFQFLCMVCGKKFIYSRSLEQHLLVHTDNSFSCRYCSKTFRWKETWKRHTESHEKLLIRNTASTTSYETSSVDILDTAINETLGLQPQDSMACTLCANGCDDGMSMCQKHSKNNHSTSYKCSDCEEAFSTLAEYTVHKKTHGILEESNNKVKEKEELETIQKQMLMSGNVKESPQVHTQEILMGILQENSVPASSLEENNQLPMELQQEKNHLLFQVPQESSQVSLQIYQDSNEVSLQISQENNQLPLQIPQENRHVSLQISQETSDLPLQIPQENS